MISIILTSPAISFRHFLLPIGCSEFPHYVPISRLQAVKLQASLEFLILFVFRKVTSLFLNSAQKFSFRENLVIFFLRNKTLNLLGRLSYPENHNIICAVAKYLEKKLQLYCTITQETHTYHHVSIYV